MANYTKVSQTNLQQILNEYGIDQFSDFTPIEQGNSNSSFYIVTKKGEYILTIFEEKDIKQAIDFARFLEWLKTYDFFTSTICLTKSGQITSKFKQKPLILKNWVAGEIIQDLSEKMIIEAGKTLAKLHQIPVPDFLPKDHAYGVQTFSPMIKKGADKKYEEWLKGQMQRIETITNKNSPKGLIHGDLFFDNIIYKNNNLKAIIDFEEACSYYLVFDLGMSIIGLCRDLEDINLSKVKSFIKGYQEIRNLEPIEKEHLKCFAEYAATATSKWRYKKYNFDSPSSKSNNKHWEMANIANQIKSIPNEKFLTSIFN